MTMRTIPALVVGLGGTGKRVLTHLKRRIYDTYGKESLPWIRLLSIDTDNAEVNNPPVQSQITNSHIQLDNDESLIIDQSDVPLVISNLDAPENRHIKEWYPDPELEVDFPKAVRGSGQIRMFGRVGLCKGDNLDRVYDRLKSCSGKISDPIVGADFPHFEVDPQMQFIYVITSLCGGTGSGMFLDIAYVLRKVVGIRAEVRRLVGMLVLPEVYESVVKPEQRQRIYANTYAAFRELNYLMNSQRRSYRIEGRNTVYADYPQDIAPFDFVFLFGNKNKRGAIISDSQGRSDRPTAPDDRVAQYISEAIVSDILSPVTSKSESLLSNILSTPNQPAYSGNNRQLPLYKSYSSLGISSVKILPVDYYRDLIVKKIEDEVVDFLLRPDPEITERLLAEEFIRTNFGDLDRELSTMTSLTEDTQYKEFRLEKFADQFGNNNTRPRAWDQIRQWVEKVQNPFVDLDRPLSIERDAIKIYQEKLSLCEDLVTRHLKEFCRDHSRGFSFMREWIDELIRMSKIQSEAVELPVENNGYLEELNEALSSLERVKGDILMLPKIPDTLKLTLQRLAAYYNNHLRTLRNAGLFRRFYLDFTEKLAALQDKLITLETVLKDQNNSCEKEMMIRIEQLPDISRDPILVDKSMIGKREIHRYLNYLLGDLWAEANWEKERPELSESKKIEITNNLGTRLLDIALDEKVPPASKREKFIEELNNFTVNWIFNALFPPDSYTKKLRAPSYQSADGKSIIFKFAPPNLLSLMASHSSPLWMVQTHQVGSATSPMYFVGLNGKNIPEELVIDIQKHVSSSFKASDITASDEAYGDVRVVIKQYDPLYSLASLENITDYENAYRNTDRSTNPLHTDKRFIAEPNPFVKWLTYQAPPPAPLKVCDRGHDIEEALRERREYCPYCDLEGHSTFIVPGKKLCPNKHVIAKDNLKCPECGHLFRSPRTNCWGCVTLKKDPVTKVEFLDTNRSQAKEPYCPVCHSLWDNRCPYCESKLDNLTVCTRGETCVDENPVILLCTNCDCPVKPDTAKCPRCFQVLAECASCKVNGEKKRMVPVSAEKCPRCGHAHDK